MTSTKNSIQRIADAGPFIFEQNTDIPLSGDGGKQVVTVITIRADVQDQGPGIARCNVYRPHDTDHGKKYPVIMVSQMRLKAKKTCNNPTLQTMGPYGKDIPLSDFHAKSYADTPVEQKSQVSQNQFLLVYKS